MKYEQLKLDNQLCFPVYAASRLITREYQPFLNELGITYPQYLVMMVLWENDGQTVNQVAGKLLLNTNTVTPLLKRMEAMGIISRERTGSDERKVHVRLTEKGKKMRDDAATIPERLAGKLKGGELDLEKLLQLRDTLNMIIKLLGEKC